MADYFEKARENVRKSGATRTFDLYADPGHSWLKVPKSAIRGIGIADKITPYSYQRGEFAYLEEDVDAPLFIRETERQYGVRVMLRQHVTDNESKIRNYDQYNPAQGGPDSAPESIDIMAKSCPTCGSAMLVQYAGGPHVCVNCGATMGEYRPRAPMRRADVRVRGHQRRSK